MARLVAASACAVLPAAAMAQAPAPLTQAAPAQPSREELNPAARVVPAPSRERDIFTPEPSGPCPLRDSALRFTLHTVSFRGSTAMSPAELSPAYAEYVGQDVPVSTVCDIRDRAARILFDRGILARVEIPEQRISGGALELEVIEAHVVNVRVRGDAGNAEAAVERYIDKLRGMTPFDMRKAQRYLLLASDVPGAQVRAAVRPSTTGERGAVDLDITVLAKTVEVLSNVQNLESKTVGRWGGLARVDLNDLTEFGDKTSLVGYHTLDSDEQWVAQLLEEARFGGDGLIARGSLVYGETRPGGPVKALELESNSFVAEAEAGYPIVRLRRRNLNVAGGFDYVDETTHSLGELLYHDQLRVFYLRMDGDDRLDLLSHIVQLTGALSVRKGIEGLGATDRGSILLTRQGGDPGAWLVRGSGRVATTVFDRLIASAQIQAQYSSDPLLDYEQLALGDLTIGRGYDPATVLGDSGVSGAFDLRYGPIAPPGPLKNFVLATPYVFFDVGHIHNNGFAAIKDRTLTSAGAGVLFRLTNRVNLDVTYANPFVATFGGGTRPDPRILVNLTASLF